LLTHIQWQDVEEKNSTPGLFKHFAWASGGDILAPQNAGPSAIGSAWRNHKRPYRYKIVDILA